ncbi:MAG: hypothetical protein IRY94_11030, partial [Rhodospirillaceae bacterium]|nr:hypothetical protein [Rhodospirillaceae bacterium]
LPRHRARWAAARRHVVGFDELVLRAPRPAHRLESWVADLLGPAEGPPEDISGGLWRRRRGAEEAGWPPAALHQERRKFLLRAGGSTWLLKFAGLGAEGERKAALARALSAAGFTPPCAGWRHGFLVERWIEDARPLEAAAAGRPAVIERIGRYLAFRARRFPADAASGAAPARLLDMARQNATEALGTAAGALFGRWSPARLEGEIRRVVTDNRMHAWEWLCLPDGRVLKADAVDHHAAHDLVGCQDVAWDVAGAVVELALGPAELARLRAVLEACWGRSLSRPLLEAMLPCYASFQLGCHALAAEALASVPAERARLERAARRYACRLEAMLRPPGASGRAVFHGTRAVFHGTR